VDLAGLCGRAIAERWLLALDFDGTLAPFASAPGLVALDPASGPLLARLAAARPVVVISGRAVADVRGRLPPGLHILGNHGSEGLPGMEADIQGARALTARWREELARIPTVPGCWLEDKGVSLTFHWRLALDHTTAEATALDLAKSLTPHPRLIRGHAVLNCLPPQLLDKGQALQRLLTTQPVQRALFVGDDWTDAAVFHLRDPRITGIQVGDLELGAEWRLPGQPSVVGLLETLVAALGSDPRP
jgi:trehalose 6-phosphate phosphatase